MLGIEAEPLDRRDGLLGDRPKPRQNRLDLSSGRFCV
jgi:hypothetical protein